MGGTQEVGRLAAKPTIPRSEKSRDLTRWQRDSALSHQDLRVQQKGVYTASYCLHTPLSMPCPPVGDTI
jgi:hypothetical protein